MLYQNMMRGQWQLMILLPLLIGMLIIVSAVETISQTQNPSITSSFIGTAAYDAAGWDVAFAGDVNKDGFDDLLIGAPENNEGGSRAGAVYLIFGSARMPALLTPLSKADVKFLGESSRDEAGLVVAGAGDVNGDGLADFMISAPMANDEAGKIYLFFGKQSGWQATLQLSEADVSFIGEARGNNAGIALSSAGDVNSDGLNDILIGAPRCDVNGDDVGKVYLILGKTSSWAKDINLATADVSFLGEFANDLLGSSVAGVGDVNHDGYDDIAIGAPNRDVDGKNDNGKVYLFFGKKGPWLSNIIAADADASFIGDKSDDLLGKSISNAGDLNGDGIADFSISASQLNSAGKVYLIFGTSSHWSQHAVPETFAPSFVGENATDYAGFPAQVADVDRDGFNDLLIAASKNSQSAQQAGKVYIIAGKSHGWDQNVSLSTADVVMLGEKAQDYAGQALASGDFDGDGFADVAVGAPGGDADHVNAGIIYLVRGPFKPSKVTLTLQTPNGGENWLSGSEQHITWTSTGEIPQVNLKYSTDNGINWKKIVDYTTNDGDYLWTIPQDPSTICLVKVEETINDSDISDKSDQVFTVCVPACDSLGLISPNGGECYLANAEHEITWNSKGSIQNVKIEYSIDGGTNWVVIISSTPNDGSYLWKLPNVHSDRCLIKVADVDGNPYDTSDKPFTIWGKPLVTVISPNSGECLKAGQQFEIKWEAACQFNSVKIQYSTNGGQDWNMVDVATPNDSSYLWTLPDVHSTNCLVKVADVDCDPEDISDTPFTIWGKAPITVIAPNGGECLTPGQMFEIKWEAACYLDSVKIQLSTDCGTNWQTIVGSTPNDGSYVWTVPNIHSDKCLIKVADLDCDPYDISDKPFTIWAKAPITVIAPNGGECLIVGQPFEINWQACSQFDSVRIQFSTDGGKNWTIVVNGTPNDGSYLWTVPTVHSKDCLVKVADLDGDPFDVSDKPFTIWGKPLVTVISPNGGECLKAGQQFEIKWEACCIFDSLKIQYSIDGGKNWTMVVYGTPNNGSYTWTVPAVQSKNCLIKVADLDCDPYDVSDKPFTICSPPYVTVIQPNGGENLRVGTQYEIKWYACCFIDSVKIQSSNDGGQNWINIISKTKNDSSYMWTVPNTPSTNCLVKVADVDCDPFDISDKVFTITSSILANFDANIMTGSQPLEVHFVNLTTENALRWQWNFGDGHSSEEKEPVHTYNIPGIYAVKLTTHYQTTIDSVTKTDFVRVHEKETFARLDLISSTPTLPQQDWTNAIDGDIYGWDGTVVMEGNQPGVIFCVADSTSREVNSIALLTDTGIGYEERWIRHFQVQVSVSGITPGDFHTVLDTVKTTGAMEVFPIDPVPARFVKVVILSPSNGTVQLGELEVYLSEPTASRAINGPALTPDQFRLAQNYPNPFNPGTTIKFEIPKTSQVKLEIYNVLGEKIRTIDNSRKDPGVYELTWDGKNKDGATMPSGVYLYILTTDEHREVRKMILTK